MKKILVFLVSLISLKSFGQFPVNQTLGSDSTLVTSKGGMKSRFINKAFSDTTQANLQRIKFYDGSQLYTNSAGGQLWLRDSTLNKWVLIGGAGFTQALNGTSVNGTIVELGGVNSPLTKYTVIPLNGFPLTINHNGNSTGAALDSNSLRLKNDSAATVNFNQTSPSLSFKGGGWRTTGGGVPYTAQFRINMRGIKDVGSAALLQLSGAGESGVFAVGATFEGANSVLSSPSTAAGNNNGMFFTTGRINGAYVWYNQTFNNIILGSSSNLASPSLTASNNIAIGAGTMTALTSGNYNTGVGHNIMQSATTATLNTAVGEAALKTLTTGQQNSAFGVNALMLTTSGQKNNAVGAGALEENTTGSFNSANGMDALLHNSTGSNNVGVGWLAYGNNITGSLNTVVGFNSFNGVVHGNNNVMVGGSITALNDTIHNSIGIGTGVVIPDSGTIVIGTALQTKNYQYGIAAGAGTKAVRYDPTTRQLFYADTTTGGGGSPQGLQSVLTVDPVLVGSNTITIPNSETLTINGNNAASGLIININAKERILATNAHTIITGGTGSATPNQGAIVVGDSIYMLPYQGKLNIDSLRSGYIDTTNYKPLARKVSLGGVPGGDVVQMNSWAQLFGGGASGITIGTTTITSGTNDYVLYQAGGVVSQDAGFQFNGTTNQLRITGPASSLTNGPKVRAYFDSDANPAKDELFYAHDNLSIALDSWFDGGASNWKASHTSAFGISKVGGNLVFRGDGGLTAGNNFTPTDRFFMSTTGAIRMTAYGAGTATFDASGNITSVSDGRLKNIVGDYKAGLKEIMQLNPIVYKWKAESGMETVHEYAGLDAREVYKVFGELGSGENSGYRTVQDRALIAALINSVKELQARVEMLEKQINK